MVVAATAAVVVVVNALNEIHLLRRDKKQITKKRVSCVCAMSIYLYLEILSRDERKVCNQIADKSDIRLSKIYDSIHLNA